MYQILFFLTLGDQIDMLSWLSFVYHYHFLFIDVDGPGLIVLPCFLSSW